MKRVLLFVALFVTGCSSSETTTVRMKVASARWDKCISAFEPVRFTTRVKDESGRELSFSGICNFEVGHVYRITINRSDGSLVSYEEVLTADGKNRTFTVTMDPDGNKVSVEEVEPKGGKR